MLLVIRMAQQELVEFIKARDPAFYEYLLQRKIPAEFKPEPEKTAAVLKHITRDTCRACRSDGAKLKCAVCGVARYCNVECQRIDEDEHKKYCEFDARFKAGLKESLYEGNLDD
jgi:hypothetical protein